ncbi:response regulator transcription factor [Streptomyces sp. W16]|uniref:response regulator transcription factor n=1 Tax=Streptomyces sp. W16 TaxID=3076631 RepID=UPI00295B6354|nr:response regulator transcription factor [Streptomyces sp. W16]MDV9172161.1 response regulator transcription factor [Streptomyces sp. W16]
MRSSERLVVALASAGVTWPHEDWPDPDDQYVDRVVHVLPPFHGLAETTADVVVLHCEDPAASFPGLLDVLRTRNVPAIVVSPRQNTEAVVDVFRAGAGYLVEGDHCPQMMSSAVLAATVGHTYLSPTACDALREGARRMAATDEAMERLRALLSPREQQIMELLSTGLGAQQIGQRLRLSEKTVRNNLSNIYAKLDARSGTDAVLRWLGATPVLRT